MDMVTFKKWITRIGGAGVITTIIVLAFVGLLHHKAISVLLGAAMAEALWFVWYKPSLGKVEDLDHDKLQAVLLLRGLLIIACVLGFTLGL